ncbi:MAG TPA: hypothetical protein VED85_04760 [Burkholderiaceae bacterium]|nr:hypothetical protein [Burkholderiaceae bacterium]
MKRTLVILRLAASEGRFAVPWSVLPHMDRAWAGKAAHRGQKGNSATPPIIGCAMAPVGRRSQLVDIKAPPH